MRRAVGEAGLDGLVNNAGDRDPEPAGDDADRGLPPPDRVNLTGQVAVTQAMLPLIRRARGRIVFVSSIGGRIAFPLTAPTTRRKFGVEAVGDVLAPGAAPLGDRGLVVEPGSIDTADLGAGRARGRRGRRDARPGGAKQLYGEAIDSYRTAVKRTAERGIPPRRSAEAIEHALSARRPRTRYLVGLDARVQARAQARCSRPCLRRAQSLASMGL